MSSGVDQDIRGMFLSISIIIINGPVLMWLKFQFLVSGHVICKDKIKDEEYK